jgi:TolA-binding protein
MSLDSVMDLIEKSKKEGLNFSEVNRIINAIRQENNKAIQDQQSQISKLTLEVSTLRNELEAKIANEKSFNHTITSLKEDLAKKNEQKY